MSCGNMYRVVLKFMTLLAVGTSASTPYHNKNFQCGPYGFICEGKQKLRLCEGDNFLGPMFLCPSGTICNEDSSDVCENAINFVEPEIRSLRCRRYERIADPSIPGCKGYILCLPNKNRFQGIKFKCTGSTVFNGFTRTCSAPDRYQCPMSNVTKPKEDIFETHKPRTPHRDDFGYKNTSANLPKPRPIDCKNYKLTVTQDNTPVRAAYFCPPRPPSSGLPVRCTVFSNQFCIILERNDEDQFIENLGAAYRRPRTQSCSHSNHIAK